MTHPASTRPAHAEKPATARTSGTTKQVPYTKVPSVRTKALSSLRQGAEALRRWAKEQLHLANRLSHARNQQLDMLARLERFR